MLFLKLMIVVFVRTFCTELQDEVFKIMLDLCPEQYVPVNNLTVTYNLSTSNGSCCIDKYFLSKEGSFVTDRDTTTVYGQTCLFPYVNKFQTSQQKVRSYNIITLEPKHGCEIRESDDHDITDVNRPTCNDSEVSPLRRFLPVYSHISRLIYKNPQCAYCHGQYSVDVWNVRVTCLDRSPFSLKDNLCRYYFSYTGDSSDIDHLECFTDKFSACPKATPKKYNLSPSVDLSMVNIEEACKMEPLPRFVHHYRSKNVFCFLCHYLQSLIPPVECMQPFEDETDRLLSTDFTRLLDPRFTTALLDSQSQSVPKSCIGDTTGSEICQPVSCPLGQVSVHTDKGKSCQFDSLRWTVGSYFSIYLLIKFDQHIPVNETALDMTFWRNQLNSPWSLPWYIDTVYYPIFKNIRPVQVMARDLNNTPKENRVKTFDHIYIKLLYQTKSVNPKRFITPIKETLQKKWYLKLHKTIIGRQDFSPHTFKSMAGFNSMSIRYELQTYIVKANIYPLIYKSFRIRINSGLSYVINKLMFCNNVELAVDYVNVLAMNHGLRGPTAISIYGLNSTLFDNEFTSELNGFRTFRVCVSDTTAHSRAHFDRYRSMKAYVLYVVAVVVFFEIIC